MQQWKKQTKTLQVKFKYTMLLINKQKLEKKEKIFRVLM